MIDNSISLVIGYGLAVVLYGGFTLHLLLRRKALAAVLAEHTDTKAA